MQQAFRQLASFMQDKSMAATDGISAIMENVDLAKASPVWLQNASGVYVKVNSKHKGS